MRDSAPHWTCASDAYSSAINIYKALPSSLHPYRNIKMRFSSYATIVSSASLAFAVPAKRQASSTAAGGSTSTVSAVPGPVTPSPVPAPAGGIGFNSTPTYKPMSDFDFQSLNLGLHQELIELDLFHYGLAQFSSQDFEDAGLTPSDQYLIEFMADQEVGHATIFENFLAR